MAKDLDLSEFGGTPELDLSEFDQPAPQPASTARRAADTGLALGRGIVAVPETAVGLSNIVTGGRTGKAVERLGVRFKDAKQVLTDFQSDEQKAADAQVQQADGFLPTVGAMVENPSTIANAVAESVPSMLAGGAVSRGLVNKGVGAITAGAVGEGVVSAGSAAEQVRQEGATGFLTPKQAALAATSGAATGVINRASGKLADKLGIADVNTTMATGKLGGGTDRGILRRTAYGAVNEGVLQELPQSMQEQALQNLALDKPVGEGVAEAGAAGMLVGNLTGGAFGAVSRSPQTPSIETDSPDVGAVNPPPTAPGVSPSVQGGGIAPPQEPPKPPPAPPPPPPSKAQAMGINPAAGPLQAAAGVTVDTGADVITQDQEAQKQKAEAAAKEKAKPGADGKKPEPEAPPPVQPVTPDPTAPITGPFTQAIHGASNVTPPPAPAVDPQGPAATQGAGTAADTPAAPGVGADQGPQGAGPVPVAVPEPAPAKPSEQPDNGALKTGVEGVSAPAGNYKPGDKLTTNGRTFLVTGVAHTGKTITVKATDGKGFAAGEIPVSQPTQESTNATQQSRPGETIDPETGEITQSGPQGAGGDGGQRPADALQPGADAKGPQPAPGQPTAPAPASTPPEGKPASTAESVAARERKDRWLKNVADAHRLAGSTGVQIGGVVNGRVNFLGNPNATKQGRALQGSVEEAINAGATPQEIVDAARKPAAPAQPKPPAPTIPVDMGAHTAATSPLNDRPEPTQAQKDAGNYKKAHIVLGGLEISIENPEGSTRSGVDPDGKPWSNTMTGHYGYIKRTTGSDGEQQDVYLKPGTPLDYAGPVFVVDQIDPKTGKHDEYKSMVGYKSPMEARKAYMSNYAKDWKGLKSVKAMTWDEFKAWVKGDKPPVKVAPASAVTTSDGPNARAMDYLGRPIDGKPVNAGDIFTTSSGRQTAPYPSAKRQQAVSQWLIDNAIAEAKSRDDTMNTAVFGNEKPMKGGTLPPASQDSMLEYLFGQQPAVPKSILKPLAPASNAAGATSAQQQATAEKEPTSTAPTKPTGGKNLRAAAYDRNPLLTFLAQHGLFHDKDKPGSQKAEFSPDKQVMVMGYGPVFRKTGMKPDLLTELAIEDGYLPQGADESQMVDLIRRAIGGERIAPLYTEGAAETEMQKRMQAVDDLRELDDNEVADLDPDMFVESNVSTEDAMRALGFTEQEIHDATTQGPRAPQEGRQGRGEPDEAQAAGPGQGAQGGPRAPPAEAEPEGLTAPTRADVIAQQDRVENAQALDDKAQIDREADGFQLQTQSVETRKDNTGDMFGGPSVDDYQQDMARRRKPGTEPEGPSLFDEPAEPEQAAITRDEAGNMSRGDIVRDSKGVEYYAWSARFGRIEVMPMQDGKPVVNNASAIRFALDDATKAANPEYRTDPLYLVRKAPAESEPTDEPDRNGLRAADRYARDLASAAQELASQIYGDFNEADFDPAEVLPGLQVFAKDAGVPADELRQAVLKNLRASTMSRANLRKVEKALDPTKAPVETAAPATAAHKVGDLVKLTKPGVNGRVNIAGTITKILPDGRLEIRTQQDGYMTVAPSELGHKPTAAPATTATTRSRPRDTITFQTPIKGPSGSSLVSYTWQWMPMDVVDARGEDRTVRVSDWDKADTNAETGREIVHQFVVAAPDGSTQTVSAETAVRLLGFAGDEAAPFKSATSAAKTLARLRMQAYELDTLMEQFTKDHDAVKAMRTPAPKSERNAEGWFEMGDAKVRQLEPGAMLPERLRTLTRAWRDNRLQERGWKSGEATKDLLGSQVADIGQRIKRAEKRIADLGKETPAQEKPGAPPAWHTAIPDHGTKVVPADEKNYSQISHRVATEAVEAVTQTQAMGNMGLYAYVLPSRDGYHGAARLFPDDQTPPAPWTLLFPEAVRMGMMTKEQAIEKLVGPLRRAPILGTMPANAPAPSDSTAFPLAEADSSYSGISHMGSQRAASDRDSYEANIRGELDAARPLATTDAQKTAMDKAEGRLREDYIKAYRRVMSVRANTYSGHIAGRSGLNSKQANARNSSLDKANEQFDQWIKDNTGRIKAAVLAARSPEQLAAEQNAADAKVAERERKNAEFVGKLLNFKAGDDLRFGSAIVVKVNKDRDGYPSSLTVKDAGGVALSDDKIDLVSVIYKGDKDKLRAVVDGIRKDQAKEPEAPVATMDAIEGETALWARVTDGKATPEEFKAGFEQWVSGKEAIVELLSKRKKDELLGMMNSMSAYRHKSSNKAEIVDAVWRDGVGNYTLGRGLTYGMGKNAYVDAVRRLVEATDADQLAQFVADHKASQEAAVARMAQAKEAVKDPKTLDDFVLWMRVKKASGKTFQEARMMLTPEQRATYDDLVASESRGARKQSEDVERTKVRVAGQVVDGDIIATKHTKKGHDLFVVKLAERVSREDYETLNQGAKRIGGYYSSFRGGGAIPGFQFTDRAQAEAFVKLAQGDSAGAIAAAQERRDAFADDRSQTAAERLNEMADRLDDAASEALAVERKANTARRARFAAAAESAAREGQAMAKTMRNVATAITEGRAKFLDRVRTKTQIELLQAYVSSAQGDQLRAKYPTYMEQEKRKGQPPDAETADFAEFPSFTAFRSDLASLGRQLLEVDGTKLLGQQIMKVADDVTDAYLKFAKENFHKVATFSKTGGGIAAFSTRDAAQTAIQRSGYKGKAIAYQVKRGEHAVIMSPSEAINRGLWDGDGDKRITLTGEFGAELVEKIGRAARRGARVSVPWQFESAYDRRKKLSRMGIETPAEFRAALREFISLREQAIEADRVKMLERAMVGKAKDGLDFFPTPASVADEMIAAADIKPEMAVLEPSAGMGHIADRIRAAGAEPDVIELAGDRRELLQEKGYHLAPVSDFLDLKPREFFTYGDVFRAPDGTEGVMMGVGMMGSRRVVLKPLVDGVEIDYRRGEWYDRDELVGVRHRGTDSGYDRIVMNPPFSDGRDILHVQHAYTLLRPGGRLVALMGESAFTNQNKRATEFREWLESVGGTEEKLAEGTFNDPSLPVNTSANARMVVIEKEATSGNGAMFARSNRTGGVHMDDAEAIIAQVREALPTAPPIIALESIAQAPADLRKFIREAGAQDDFEAAYHNGKIYALPSNVGSASRLQFLLAHHEIRHHGFASMLGPRKNQVLFSIHATNANVRAAAAEQVRRGYATSKVLATEEALADMAVEDLVKLNGWDKIVAAVREWLRGAVMRLRRAGLGRVADAIEPSAWTDKDVAALIARAEGVSRGGSAKYASEGTVFGQDGDMPAFYSALTREINANTARAQPAMGWASTIQGLVKAGKIKQDEADWSGVLDWLRLQEGKVTRDQLVAYLDANGVRVEETVLGGGNKPPGYDADIELLSDNGLTLERNPEDPSMVAFMDENGDLLSADELAEEPGLAKDLVLAAYRVQEAADADKVPTRYGGGNLVLPGGTNYREVLLTLPTGGPSQVEALSDAELRALILRNDSNAEVDDTSRSDLLAMISNMDMSSTDIAKLTGKNTAQYKSSHWDLPNILAHIRVNDRVDADGKKVLFVEELQSDWGQAGKKKGFGTRPQFTVRDRFGHLRGNFDSEAEAQAYIDNPPIDMHNLVHGFGTIVPTESVGIPAAPFVTKTDAWLSLALKRIVKMAVDEGYERVAFVNGDQSAARYDLSKQVKRISWIDDRNRGGRIVTIKPEGGKDIDLRVADDGTVGGINFTDGAGGDFGGKKLSDVIGKDLADKVLATKSGNLSGNGLKVGGEGMKAFYDRIVPNTLKDVLRKVGGGQLERTFNTGAKAAAEIGDFLASVGRAPEPSAAVGINLAFDITPAMREKVAGGLPLFARGDKITEFNSDGPAKEFERYKRLVDQVGQEYTAKGSTMTFEEFTAKVKPLQDKMWEAHFKLEKWKAGRPATSTEEVFPGFQEIPIGTRILATHGLKYPEPTMGTVVGRRGLRMGEKAYVLPEVDFGDGDGRAVLPGDIKEVFAGPRTMFARGGLDSVTDKINTTTKTAGNTAAHYRGLGLQALGRRQITELYGDILPQLGSYNTLMAQMDADKNEAGAQADQIAQDWGKLKDERQLAELMHDATLAQMDPEKPLMRGDDPLTYEPLRERYAALSPEAKKVYADARDAYRTHHENVRKALRDRIERSELRGQRKAELLKQMDDEFYQSVKGVYFPLARFGDYVVIVRNMTGKAVSVNRAETINEAEALQVELRKAYPEMTVGKVLKSKEFNAGRDAVGRGFMQNLYEALGKADMDDKQRGDLEDMLGQLYLSALPDLSWAKHGIHRKGTPGFSQDARRAFAQNTFHGARYLSKVRYSDLLENELSDAQKQVDGMNESESFDSVKAQQVIDEMVKRHDAAMNPDGNALSTALTSIGFVFHLGLSPASAVVNLTQTALVAYPIMGAKWGFDKAAAALLKASQQAAANRNDISAALSPEEKLAYNEAVRSGVIDVTMAHDLAGISQGEDAKVSWKLRPVMRWASFLFHHAEKFNRQATFVAAYRLAREADTPMAQAYEQAVKATYDGHFDYSAANRPRIMQGNAAKVILLFKQYGQNMVYTLARQAYLSMKGKNQFERAQARKALGGLLTMHAAAAGVLGLPMVSTLLAAASMLGGDDDEPWDAEVALRNMLAEALGDQAADVLARGLSRLTPWDISGRVGLDKLILPDIQEGLEGQDLANSAMAAALGPVAGIGISMLKGLHEISDGNWARGLEAMAPSLARGPLKALRYGTEGAIDKTGKPIVEDVGAFGIAGQALGFSPSEVQLATEAKSAVHQADAKLAKRRATLMRHYAMAVIAGDEEGAADAREDILAFNEKNPGRRINPLQMARSVATRKKQIAESQGGVYLPKTRRDAMEAGQFGMP